MCWLLTILERERVKLVDMHIVVMVQGDEPMTHPQMISEAVNPLVEDSKVLVKPIYLVRLKVRKSLKTEIALKWYVIKNSTQFICLENLSQQAVKVLLHQNKTGLYHTFSARFSAAVYIYATSLL